MDALKKLIHVLITSCYQSVVKNSNCQEKHFWDRKEMLLAVWFWLLQILILVELLLPPEVSLENQVQVIGYLVTSFFNISIRFMILKTKKLDLFLLVIDYLSLIFLAISMTSSNLIFPLCTGFFTFFLSRGGSLRAWSTRGDAVGSTVTKQTLFWTITSTKILIPFH